MTNDEKLELLRFLVFLRGKLQNLSFELELMKEDTTKIDKAEKRAAKAIQTLRIELMKKWQGNAATIMSDLRALNDTAQRKVRELSGAQDRAAKLAEIVGLIDRGLAVVGNILPGANLV